MSDKAVSETRLTDTPITDANAFNPHRADDPGSEVVDAEIARALERRLAAAEAEKDAFKKECNLLTHKVITCGVAAEHPNGNLSKTGAYAAKWNSPQAEAVRKLRDRADAAESALRSAGERVRNALRLAKNWIEHDEGRTLEQILAIEARGKEHGVSAFNPEFMAACIAIDTAIRALPVQGEVKINAAPQEKREDAHRADGDGALPESDSPAGAAPTEPPLAGAKGAK